MHVKINTTGTDLHSLSSKGIVRHLKNFKRIIKDFVYGATTYQYVLELERKIFHNECILEIAVLGDRYGLPTSCYYKLKLLPYWITRLNEMDKEILREKDVLEEGS
ncbi:MAG: hypothetical protein QXI11_05285 [Thermoproteota archaeon]